MILFDIGLTGLDESGIGDDGGLKVDDWGVILLEKDLNGYEQAMIIVGDGIIKWIQEGFLL